MKTQNIISVAIRGLAAVALSVGAASSFAATWKNSYSCVGKLAAGATCGGDAALYAVTANSNGMDTSTQAVVWGWGTSGLGVVNTQENSKLLDPGTGPHAIDNISGIDGIVFNYSTKVNLTGFTVGWDGEGRTDSYSDSDASVYVWTGAVAPTSYGYGNGWTLVSDYAEAGGKGNTDKVISTNYYSSYWLISATTQSGSVGDDAFKIVAISGQPCDKTLVGNECKTVTTPPGNQVPEPGSLALVGLGAMGMIAARRRQQRQQNLAA